MSAYIKRFIKVHGVKFSVLFLLVFGIVQALLGILGIPYNAGLGMIAFIFVLSLILYSLGIVKLNI